MTEKQIRAIHDGFSDYVHNCPEEALEWEMWQAACEWAWANPRASLGKKSAPFPGGDELKALSGNGRK